MTLKSEKKTTAIISIAIPTYNRCHRLSETLARLSMHPEVHEDWIEVVISDNASTDNTPEIVSEFTKRTGKVVSYARNDKNLGIDGNIHVVSRLATGNYLLLMSDDDFLLHGSLTKLRDIVEKTQDLLFCFLNGGYFTGTYDPNANLPSIVKLHEQLTTKNPNEILSKIGVWSTFISSFFVERKSWLRVSSAESFIGSDIYLTHILFRMLAKESNRTSIITSEKLIAARAEYTGSYRVFHAFGYSFLKLITQEAPVMGFDVKVMRRIKIDMILRFLPMNVMMIRRGSGRRALKVEEIKSLMRYTWWEPRAWILLLPIALLPSGAIEIMMKIKRILYKRSIFD